MALRHLSFGTAIDAYVAQADQLFEAWQAGDLDAVRLMHGIDDARIGLARWYSFRDWDALAAWAAAAANAGSPVSRFEIAVEAVIGGDAAALDRLLREDPSLVRARSSMLTNQDPPAHRATLLHYVAANGVEGWRQKTPPNAVEIETLLLRAGAEPDALADAYGGQWSTMGLLVSSVHPAAAGLQVALAETLLDFGAALEGVGADPWSTPLMTALAFGYLDTAQALVRRGAGVTNVAAAAGLGLLPDVRRLLPGADGLARHKALVLAAQHGQTAVVELLLDTGEDPDRYNPAGNHAHSTPLHLATWGGHLETIQLLVRRGARLDLPDTIHKSTPRGWAEFGGRTAIAEYLRSAEEWPERSRGG